MASRPDSFTAVNVGEKVYQCNAKFDRVDFFPDLGHYILKLYDDTDGLVSVHTDEQSAARLVDEAELPLVVREFMFASEYEAYLESQASDLEDWLEE